MSLQAMNWVLYDIDPDELEQSEFRILLVMADHADTEGCGVWLGAAKISKLSRLSLRQVRYALRHLQDKGIIRRGDQRLVKHLPGNKRPVVYDLVMDEDRGATIAPQTEEQGCNVTAPQTEEQGCNVTAPQTEEQGCNVTAPRKDSLGCNRGATGVQSGVQHDCTQTQYKEEPYKPREYAHARETQNQPTGRTQALADWKPNLAHHDLADDLKLDVDYEAGKFRDRLLANDAIPANLDAAFDLWLKRGAELGLGGRETPKAKTCQHTWACRHTQAILDRVGISRDDTDTAGRVAQRLKRGDAPEAIVDDLLEMRDHEWWEAA